MVNVQKCGQLYILKKLQHIMANGKGHIKRQICFKKNNRLAYEA